MKTPIAETQVRAARELLRWDQKKLATQASLGLATVRRYELGQGGSEKTVAKLVDALEKAGILFIGERSIGRVAVSAAVGLRVEGKPEPRPAIREYNYKRPRKPKNKPNSSKRGST